MSLANTCLDFGFLGDHHIEDKKFQEHTCELTGYPNQSCDVCADLFAFCKFPER
jgi:hypothetical protein